MNQLNHLYQAIIFDYGGVLVDWDPRYLYRKLFNSNSAAMERFLKEIDFFEWNLKQDKGRPFAEGVAELTERFPHYADLIKAYDERWEESIAGPIQPTVDILYSLKQADYLLYGLSNWSAEKHRLVRHRYQFFDWFDAIVISGQVKLVKPDPRIFYVLLEKIGHEAKACLFIDDTEVNIKVASRLGFKTIRFESPEQLKNELIHRGLLLP